MTLTSKRTRLNVVLLDAVGVDDIAGLHRLAGDHVAVAAIRPGGRTQRVASMQSALFEAIGVSDDVSGVGRDVTADWHHLHVHLSDIDDLIVLDAHHLDEDKAQAIIQLAVATATNLWLAIHTQHLADQTRDALAAWPVEYVPAKRFLKRFRGRTTAEATRSDDVADDQAVRVPYCDWPTFRATCRNMLDPNDFAAVDTRYIASYQVATDWLRAEGDVSEETFARWLRDMFDKCVTADQMLTTVRATQAALLVSGWFVKFDLDAFLGSNSRVHTPAVRSSETWRRLRAYRQAHRRATCALAAAGLSLDDMRDIRMRHVDAATGTVSVGGRTVTVEEAARPALRSQVVHQLSLGRTADDVLLADFDGEPLSDYQLARSVTEPVLEAGVALLSGQVVRRTTNDARWTRRQGISLQHL